MAGLERVYETAHVYRAEPHASSRHLTEYYSLDVEFGFIDGPEDVIQLERELLTDMFENLNRKYGDVIGKYRDGLAAVDARTFRVGSSTLVWKCCDPSLDVRTLWTISIRKRSGSFAKGLRRRDRDSGGVCARLSVGGAAVLHGSAPGIARRGRAVSICCSKASKSLPADSDCISGKIWRRRCVRRSIDPSNFESHLAMFDLGMPPHGGFAIGLERLTCQVLNLANVRQAVLYPRDRYKLTP